MTDENGKKPTRRRRRRRRRSPLQNPQSEAQKGGEAAAEDTARETVAVEDDGAEGGGASEQAQGQDGGGKPRRRRKGGRSGKGGEKGEKSQKGQKGGQHDQGGGDDGGGGERVEMAGILETRKDGSGYLRDPGKDLRAEPDDPKVSQQLVRKFGLKEGVLVAGNGRPGKGQQPPRLEFVETVDGIPLKEARNRRTFKKLTVIDPDFHYELGTHEQDTQLSMRIVDLLCPIGRGQRGLLVAPPRTGKTTLLMGVADAMQALYPDVHLIVLLVDERPEEATYWKRSVEHGEVFVSTMDESPKNHVRLVELVQARAERLVEAGKEVVILLDSITRMTRAFNNVMGGKNARTMSGGLDSKVFTKPKHFFGAARNTEDAGSLTILATALVDTGSRMDQVIYEEFKGTGNMELTLDRRLADRRVFPAVSIEQTATRKEEKLLSRPVLRKVNILRRVLSRMRPREAMEMLVDRLGRYPSNQEFLGAFSMDDVE